MRKKISRALLLALIVTMAFTVFGCGQEETAAPQDEETQQEAEETQQETEETGEAEALPVGSYEDGIYFAQEDGFSGSGWKYVATLVVEDGEIVEADWNGAHKSAGDPKKKVAKDGRYNMVEYGGAQAEWDVQAESAEEYLLETQDPTDINYTSEDGHTDDISGVTIHVVEFFDLAEKALRAGPVGRGPVEEDGHYYAVEEEFGSTGWRYSADLTVINGYIVAANWNGASRDGGTDKKTRSQNGNYGMVERGGAQSEWYVQANAAEEYLIETQDPTDINYTSEDGHTDDISGVTIHVVEFFDLVEKALDKGPVPVGSYEDGHYHAEAPEFSHGWKATVDLTVYNGRIMAANWNAVDEEGNDKKTQSQEGEYGMVENSDAQSEWYVQARAAEAYLLETQDPTEITYSKENSYTDDISGVSIRVSEFFQLAEKALEEGPVEEE